LVAIDDADTTPAVYSIVAASSFKTTAAFRCTVFSMAPFIVLSITFVASIVAGRIGVPFRFGWWTALRLALAGMFLLTASAHWGRRRPDLIRMVPPTLPRRDLLVTITGMLELLGAVGLLIPPVAPWAALGLTLLLIAVFPANVRAAREKLTLGGQPATPLILRTCLQIVFLTATIAVMVGGGW
jgi:uncharacterized membrane protein